MTHMVEDVLAVLPPRVAAEVRRIGTSQHRMDERLSEIRLRADGLSALVLSGRNIPLDTSVSEEEVGHTVQRVCGGALYAYRDTIANGYIPMAHGVRVGLCGRARYDGGQVVGIADIRSLVFRLPCAGCDTRAQLIDVWREGVGAGMLLYAPPGVGKTTALRALASYIGTQERRRVCIIDEREEFAPESFRHASVDLLRGYRRAVGIEIAVRTLSPEVLIVDEIGGEEEARAMAGALACGIPILASAHAASLGELRRKRSLAPFLACHLFDVFVGLSRTEQGYTLQTERCDVCAT